VLPEHERRTQQSPPFLRRLRRSVGEIGIES
jgi:hypothetical protein